jgi:hypothetical protein
MFYMAPIPPPGDVHGLWRAHVAADDPDRLLPGCSPSDLEWTDPLGPLKIAECRKCGTLIAVPAAAVPVRA